MQAQSPYMDCVEGTLIRLGTHTVLLIGFGDLEPPGSILAAGQMALCYAIVLLYEEDDAVIPQLAIDDFRRQYTGAAALDFLYDKGDAFPRADVLGLRVSTGRAVQVFVKELDLARPYRLYILDPDPGANPALTRVNTVIWAGEATGCTPMLSIEERHISPYLGRSVPQFVCGPDSLGTLPAMLGKENAG